MNYQYAKLRLRIVIFQWLIKLKKIIIMKKSVMEKTMSGGWDDRAMIYEVTFGIFISHW